jgi:Fe-S-cluster containining protein
MGCSGKCCAVFNFPTPPEVLATRGGPDDAFLADMLVALTPDEAEARVREFEVTPPEGFDLRTWVEAAPAYTCRHWDEETRLCGVYEQRPTMCREYPYAGGCQHDCACDYRAETHVRTKWAATRVQQAANE